MSKPFILILGTSGQLGQEFRKICSSYPDYEFHFLARTELDLENIEGVDEILEPFRDSILINCAAYTAVDKAETENTRAFQVNGEAVGKLAACCNRLNIRFIHFSTDYVFDGSSSEAYMEDAVPSPVNTYGASKLRGEQLCMKYNPESIIIRTSWVYSAFGNNFVKTMIRLLSEKESIRVVNDQVGSPTWAADLAKAAMQIISNAKWTPGIYHYANAGSVTWYQFALAIRDLIHANCNIQPIPSSGFPTAARRPAFSLLNTSKIVSTFSLSIPPWNESLASCLKELQY